MQLKAFQKTFQLLETKYSNEKVTIYSDSAYCINILTSWMHNWNKNNWKTSKGKTIKNLDIISHLYILYQKFSKSQITLVKVNGHKGIIGNELADALAQSSRKKFIDIVLNNNIKVDIKNAKNPYTYLYITLTL